MRQQWHRKHLQKKRCQEFSRPGFRYIIIFGMVSITSTTTATLSPRTMPLTFDPTSSTIPAQVSQRNWLIQFRLHLFQRGRVLGFHLSSHFLTVGHGQCFADYIFAKSTSIRSVRHLQKKPVLHYDTAFTGSRGTSASQRSPDL